MAVTLNLRIKPRVAGVCVIKRNGKVVETAPLKAATKTIAKAEADGKDSASQEDIDPL